MKIRDQKGQAGHCPLQPIESFSLNEYKRMWLISLEQRRIFKTPVLVDALNSPIEAALKNSGL